MRIIDTYIATHVVRSIGMALAVLLALISFVDFVDELGLVGRGDYSLAKAAEFVALTLPGRAFALFPLAAVVGALIGLGALAVNLELAVMQAAGVSGSRIAWAALKAAMVLVVFAVVVAEFIAPPAERLAQGRRAAALADASWVGEGARWIRDGDSFVNIRQVVSETELRDIYIYEFDNLGRLRVASQAQGARYEGDRWVLEGLRQSLLSEEGVRVQRSEEAIWSARFAPEILNVLGVKPEKLSIFGIQRYLAYLRRNELDTARFELALWTKIAYPLASAVMVLVALPLVLGRLGGAGMGQRIVVGALLGILFHVVQQASGHTGLVYGLSPFAGAFGPTLLFLSFALLSLRRVR